MYKRQGRDRHPAECDCQKAQRLEREAAEQRRKHLDTVEDLKHRGFTNPTMQEWTFANDNGKCPQMEIAHFYVEHWETMRPSKRAVRSFKIAEKFVMRTATSGSMRALRCV